MTRSSFILQALLLLSALSCHAVLAQNARFDVLEYQVLGNTHLPVIDVERAVYPHLGEGKSIDDVDKARAALEEAYRKAGYPTAMVDVPEQQVAGGCVKLQVTEGKVGKVRVVGSRYYAQGRILEKLPALAPGGVPYMPAVQEQLNALNRAATGRAVVPVLRPGKSPGTVDLDLKVRDERPLHASVEINNHHTADTTPMRLNAMLRYDNLWQREHSITLQYQTSPQDSSEVDVLSGTYVLRLDDPDKALAFYAVRSASSVSTVGDLSVIGEGTIFGARAVLTLPGEESYFHTFSLGLDYKDFGQNVLLGADTLSTPISYLPFQAQYAATRRDDSGVTRFNVAANFSLRGVGNDPQEFEDKRFKARANYFYLRGELQRQQPLPYGMNLLARIGGQFSGQPLISNEQYSTGGANSVRGYLESEALGDSGVQGLVEMHGPSYGAKLYDQVQDLHFLAFLDGARLWVKDALPGQRTGFSLASSGIGLRVNAWKQLHLALDLALPLRDGVDTGKGEWRAQAALSCEF